MLLQHERIWITGAQGQVGSAFARMLDTTELDVLLTDRDEVDITNMDEVRAYVEMNRPDVIINCAGICGIAFCEENSDLAYKVNAIGARNLSVAARSVHAEWYRFPRMIFLMGGRRSLIMNSPCPRRFPYMENPSWRERNL